MSKILHCDRPTPFIDDEAVRVTGRPLARFRHPKPKRRFCFYLVAANLISLQFLDLFFELYESVEK